jgi:curli biogenesis system outer membrane secretion channel CsgG
MPLTKISLLLVTSLLMGCSYFSFDTQTTGKKILPKHAMYATEKLSPLVDLPSPTQKINISIYDFPDLTGAYKPNDSFATYSKAVSQGADAIVIDALRSAGKGTWFNVMERKGINAINFERTLLQDSMDDKDTRQTLAIKAMQMMLNQKNEAKENSDAGININPNNRYMSEKKLFSETQTDLSKQQKQSVQINQMHNGKMRVSFPGTIAKLEPAEYILQGGIIGFDSNTVTAGAGLRLLNVGTFGEIRKDVVTVNMRLVNIITGKIILSNTITKGIYSRKLQGSGINYISIDRILEAEAGVSYNEPVFEALNLTIQAAVYDIIHQGIQEHVFTLKQSDQKKSPEVL